MTGNILPRHVFYQRLEYHDLQPDQVEALLFARNYPWARTLTDEDLYAVPLS